MLKSFIFRQSPVKLMVTTPCFAVAFRVRKEREPLPFVGRKGIAQTQA